MRLTRGVPRVAIILIKAVGRNVRLPGGVVAIPDASSVSRLTRLCSSTSMFVAFSLRRAFNGMSTRTLSYNAPIVYCGSATGPRVINRNYNCIYRGEGLGRIIRSVGGVRGGKGSFCQSGYLGCMCSGFRGRGGVNRCVSLCGRVSSGG